MIARSARTDRRLVAFLVVMSAIFGTTVYELTMTIVGVTLPHMQGSFSATPDQIAWVMTAFIIGTTVMIACTGWFTSRFGRRRFFLFSLLGFALATIMCGIAESLLAEVLWRLLQGLLGAPLIPLGQAITIDAFPENKQSLATAIWGVGAVGGVVMAPVLGGYLAENFDWRWVFYVNVPLAVLALAGAWAFIPATPREPGKPLDWVGFLALIIAIAGIQLALSRGERLDWLQSNEVLTELWVALVAVVLFIVRSARAAHPFIDLDLFADKNFLIGNVFMFVFGAVVILPIVLLPLLLQQVSGFPVMTAGAILFPRGIGVIAALIATATLFERIDPRAVLVFGFACLAVSNWQMSRWTPDVPVLEIGLNNVVQGFGSGSTFMPVIAIGFASLSRRLRTRGLAFIYLVFYLGSAIGVASIFAFHERLEQVNRAVMVEHINPFNEVFSLPSVPAAWDPGTLDGLAALSEEVSRQAQMIAYTSSFELIALVAGAMIPLVVLVRKPRPPAQD